MTAGRSFLIESLSQAILDARAKATRYRTSARTVKGQMADDCAAIAEAHEAAADVIQSHLAEATNR